MSENTQAAGGRSSFLISFPCRAPGSMAARKVPSFAYLREARGGRLGGEGASPRLIEARLLFG